MTEVGKMLEEARLKQSITLDRVERDLKIRMHYLIAMETGQWEELPGAAYATGFLRSYANYLGLSGEDFAHEYKYWRDMRGSKELSQGPSVGVFTRSKELETDGGIFQLGDKATGKKVRRRKLSKVAFVFVVLIVALGAYVYLTWKQPFSQGPIQSVEDTLDGYESSIEPDNANDMDEALPEILDKTSDGSFLPHDQEDMEWAENWITDTEVEDSSRDAVDEFKGAYLDGPDIELEAELSEAEEVVQSAQEGLLPPDTPDAVEADANFDEVLDLDDEPHTEYPDGSDLVPSVIVPSDNLHRLSREQEQPPVSVESELTLPMVLEIRANGRCWIEVHSDGNVEFSKTVEAGEQYAWTGFEEIKARFGNADVVDLIFNGQELGPAGKGVITRIFTQEDAD
ncbi:MAG: DUF4115 domain-containing protein [Firmicutes bacterium]|nr:DUF4115 domain-containing protein [Bacillota bacterium]